MKTIAFHCARPALSRELGEARFIFIVTAMRSGSSLLQHLIAQDPEIDSAGEAHIDYRSDTDLLKLIAKTRYHNRSWRSGRRVFLDKLTLTAQHPSGELIEKRSLRFVFLLRDPLAAAASLLQLDDWPYSDSPESAAAHYVERLDAMRLFAGQLDRDRAIAISYETLRETPEPCLSWIGEFIGASRKLGPEYPTQRWTGAPAKGDVSENIHAGRVLAVTASSASFPDKPALKRAMRDAHRRTLDALAARFDSRFEPTPLPAP